MKLLVFITLITPSLLQSQEINSTSGKGLNNIYNDALARFVTIIKTQDRNYKDYLDTVFVDNNYFIGDDNIAVRLKGIPVALAKYVAFYERPERQDSAVLLSIRPLHVDKGRFSVFISAEYGYNIEGRNCKWKNGIFFYYSYSEKNKTFIYRFLEYPKVLTIPPIE